MSTTLTVEVAVSNKIAVNSAVEEFVLFLVCAGDGFVASKAAVFLMANSPPKARGRSLMLPSVVMLYVTQARLHLLAP